MSRFRKEKLESIIKGIVAESVQQKLNDPRVSSLTTVTRVEMSSDLQSAKVYLSVPGEGATERTTLAAIQHAGGFLQRQVAHELSVRQCPGLTFHVDEQSKKVRQMMGLLEKIRQEEGLPQAETTDELPEGEDEAEYDERAGNGSRRTDE